MRDLELEELERAWKWREERGALAEAECVRVFHGPGEGSGLFRNLAIDRYGAHFWVTLWSGPVDGRAVDAGIATIVAFLKSKGAQSAMLIERLERGVPDEPRVILGQPPQGRYVASEREVKLWIQTQAARHPGLFLDHAPLRSWLMARSRGWKVLNTFAYTGSLSVAAGLGGAAQVTTLDLSQSYVQWARENWLLNGLPEASGDFIYGDVFEWLPRLKKKDRAYDCVILDPPSFSHGEKGKFSTSKDLGRLHELALDLLVDDGCLVTSINSANIPWAKFEADIQDALRARKRKAQVLMRLEQPETFPSPFGAAGERYLKGFVLRVKA